MCVYNENVLMNSMKIHRECFVRKKILFAYTFKPITRAYISSCVHFTITVLLVH